MKLRDYLDTEMITVKEFANKIEVHERTVYWWLSKGFTPMRFHQLRIDAETEGKVTTKDWMKKNGTKKETNKCVRGTKDNGLRSTKHLGTDKKTKLKSSKKGR